jgi:hypothetical protein
MWQNWMATLEEGTGVASANAFPSEAEWKCIDGEFKLNEYLYKLV